MRHSAFAGIALLVASGTALAQMPATIPGRSQNPGQQAVDNAACYAYANQTTHVVMARESQTPPRDQPREARPLAPPRPVEPPLPPAASGAAAASAASVPLPASATMPASEPATAVAAGASGPAAASDAAASAAAASQASDAHYAEMKMPPLPPPEPPMARYWRAYGDCMQGKGYYVR